MASQISRLLAAIALWGTTPSVMAQSTPTFLSCKMQTGAMSGKELSFMIDLPSKRVLWADNGVGLEVVFFDETRIHSRANISLSGAPQHDAIGFNFNRITLAVEAGLSEKPSNEDIAKCKAQAPGPWTKYCEYERVVDTSVGQCKLTARAF